MNIVDATKAKMNAILEHFKAEIKGLRTGRANAAVLDNVQVDVYGSAMRIKDLASITTPEARQILVVPFDPQTAGAIAKGIEKANLNLLPILEGNQVRIPVPPMDENMRKQIVKQGKELVEAAKIRVRGTRREANELIDKAKKGGELTEDLQKKFEKQVQELTDQFCKNIDDLFHAKEKEIMTV